MSFLDKKEQVLDIELTQYGKFLFANGKFEPKFYSFSDTNINYHNISGKQNDIEDRIKENATFEAQTIFSSLNNKIKKINFNEIGLDDIRIVAEPINNNIFISSLGTMSSNSSYAPSFNVSLLKGEISGNISYLTGNFYYEKIPQINIDIPYDIIISDKLEKNMEFISDSDTISDGIIDYKELENGETIQINNNFILLSILENNQNYLKDNFDIEVYEETTFYDDGLNEKKYLKPLYFREKIEQIKNNILLEPQEEEEKEFTPQFAEHYIDIKVDNEIPQNILCKFSSKVKNIFAEHQTNCKEERDSSFASNYYEEPSNKDGDNIRC